MLRFAFIVGVSYQVTGVSPSLLRSCAAVGSALPDRACGNWFVLLTKSNQEKSLVRDLAAYGIGCFLPLLQSVKFHGGRKHVIETPVFSSYVFLRGSLEDVYRADRTRRVARVIRVVDQEKLDGELRNIALAASGRHPIEIFSYLKKGMRVVVRSGPLKGLEGVVEDRKENRLFLHVAMLNVAASLEIDGSLLEPMERAV